MALCFYFFDIHKIERGIKAQNNLLCFASILAWGVSRVMGKVLRDMLYPFRKIDCALARKTDSFYIYGGYYHHALRKRFTFLAEKSLFGSVVSTTHNSISLAVVTIVRYTDHNIFKIPIRGYPNVWGWRDFRRLESLLIPTINVFTWRSPNF